MSHESESARDSPYGLKLLEAIWTISMPFSLSLSGWSIIIRFYKNIVFTQFLINQSQQKNEAELGNLWFFLSTSKELQQHQQFSGNANSRPQFFPKQYSHINAKESSRLANGHQIQIQQTLGEG